MEDLDGFSALTEAARAGKGWQPVTGCTDAAKPHLIDAISRTWKHGRLILVPSELRARELLEAFRFFDPAARYFPPKDILFYESDLRGDALLSERMAVYRALAEGEHPTVVTTFDALLERLAPPQMLDTAHLSIRQADTVNLDALRDRLAHMGYAYEDPVEEPGQFCVRGGILDVYPLTEEMPVRIELWGDEVDSVRSFNPESQRSVEMLEEVTLYPAGELGEGDFPEADARKWGNGDVSFQHEAALLKSAAFRKKQAYNLLDYFDYYSRCFAGDAKTGPFVSPETGMDFDDGTAADILAPAAKNIDMARRGCSVALFIDEPSRCLEKARAVEQEFYGAMERRLEKGGSEQDPADAGSADPAQGLPAEELFEQDPADAGNAASCEADLLLPLEELVSSLARRGGVLLTNLETTFPEFAPQAAPLFLQVRSTPAYNGSFSLLVKDLSTYKKQSYRVILLCGSRTRAQRMANDLREEGLTAFYSEDPARVLSPGEILVCYGSLTQGFSYPDIRFAVLTETDIFGAERKKHPKKKYRGGDRITDYEELKPGDYIVHESHGIGIYRGIEQVEMNRTQRDYMKIEYDRGGILYVPATQLDVIRRYSGGEDHTPKLNRLGGPEWTRTRSRVQKSVELIARDLVELYALRENLSGYQYGPDTVWQREFEEMFPYEETEDQLAAIADIKADMESPKIMDRLLCGDVGFGKTEVALRAAFKAVQENKQVVYLVPTTILAQQHYNNFLERLQNFPVNVELLCRFRTPSEQRETIRRLREGLTDIVIGTHRVLSEDVEYKDLGLLIIDEEQRFGVSHKEKIKKMKHNVDVLSLTATPIPRTLHMSMVGIRDMSVLEEPPQDRLPIQTYVMEYNEELVREAIERELHRNGQVYYVYNRVDTIAERAARVAELVPQAEVAFAHGQMSERELERVMIRFINGEIDVLVSTTIIETGMDIANVNTMIVADADRMGLAQLYQLRGRIGRSNRTSYAFLMYRRDKMLKEVAEKRLSAIREFTELGSGIRIARKDLEIRGAGNLLGEQQHGHMEAVGYELYCKMLGEAVREAKGEAAPAEFETTIDLAVDAFIPPDYIKNEYRKLDLYKRIAAIRTEDERDEMLDELIDRFGTPPQPVQNLLTVSLLRETAHALYFTEIKETPAGISFTIYEQAPIDAAKIPDVVAALTPALTFNANYGHPYFLYRRKRDDASAIEAVGKVLGTCRIYLSVNP